MAACGDRETMTASKHLMALLRSHIQGDNEQFLSVAMQIAAARDDNEQVVGGGNDDGWVLGPRLRDRGSLHSDLWRGTATDLAGRHGIGVFPIGGWWREKPALERAGRKARYALVATLRASVDVDLYAEIANTVGIEIDISTTQG